MEINLTIHCCLCSKQSDHKVVLPDGWDHRYGGIDDENSGFCPDHSDVAEFAGSQCPGCVGGWGDCDLWRDFAHSGRRKLTPADFIKIERGICPRRTNGTFGVSSLGVEQLDLSTKATTKSGLQLATAIRDYWAAYPER